MDDYWSDDNKTRVGDDDFRTPVVLGNLLRKTGRWLLTFKDIPNVFYGSTYETLSAEAVQDDFGRLVLVSDRDGRVVLS